MTNNGFDVEKFYVYRSLHHDESWGAIIIGSDMPERLPNISFGIKIFAKNEKEAISKAKEVYDKIHIYDSDKENIRRFFIAGMKVYTGTADIDTIIDKAMKCAVLSNYKYNEHFKSLEEGTDNE